MSRSNVERRARQGDTIRVQAGAWQLQTLRAQIDGMSPGDPGFGELFEAAETAAADMAARLPVMSRPNGASRRGAGELFMAAAERSVAHDLGEAAVSWAPAHEAPAADPQGLLGPAAMAGVATETVFV